MSDQPSAANPLPTSSQQRRHQYLEALGITSWLPTRALPAAAPSDAWVWDFRYPAPDIPFSAPVQAPVPAGNAPRPARPQPAASVDPARVRAALNDTLALVAEPAPKKAAPAPQVKLAPKPKQPGKVPRFRLALQVYGDCLVVESLPTAGQGGLSQAHLSLLKNIGCFLLPEPPEHIPRAVVLKWPMLAGSSLDQSRPEALAAVQYKLTRLLAEHGCTRLLLLGEVAMQMVLDTDEALDVLHGEVLSVAQRLPDFPQLTAVASHSLSELLMLHELKAVLWQDMQPLIRQPVDVTLQTEN
ncbi:MAG: hypothetical protein OIF57_00140 [Marinobacterium sp.]|nr:hypothetical protein [Marinobacterium sp.]